MIQIKIRDTLVDIVEKIESQKTGDIILDFPLGHPILHNYVSLKVLKSKTKDRRFIIATSDKVGRKIGKSLGIEYSLVKHRSFLEQNSQTELMKHNFSFWEFLKFQVHSYKQEFTASIEANKKFNALGKYSHIYGERNSLYIFFIILFFSLLLFAFIYYFVVSQTTIFITPERIIKTQAHNFILKENIENNILGNNKYIKIEVLSQKIQSSETYASTGIRSNSGSRSQGKVQLYNLYPEPQELISGTRLQTSDGVVFETPSWVKIPASSVDNFGNTIPGEIVVKVTAKQKDATGKYTGTQGGISEGISLILPALGQEEQKMIYGESIEEFSGGRDVFQKIVAETDLESAELLFREKLKNVALKSIKKNIADINGENGTEFDILSGGKSIIYGETEVFIEPGITAGDIRENFGVTGSITITVYIYNKASIIQKLQTLIGERKLEGIEKVAQIDKNSLRMSQLIYIQEANENDPNDIEDDLDFELKATFEIESIFVHDFLNVENSYIKLLRSKIRGLPKKEAEKVLLNDPKVSNVEINIRPFFIKSVSNVSNNIIFKIR